MFRFFAVLIAVASLSACENIDDISGKPVPIGEFALGHNIVVAPALVKGPASREAEDAVWIASVTKAIDGRFSRYDGDQLYHFGISLEGYVLAQPGIPLILSPKSALIFKLTVWDDAAGKKLHDEPEQITVLESIDGDSLVGSGLTKTAEEQMEALSVNAAKLIQRWITRQHRQERWFKRTKPEITQADAPKEDAVDEAVSTESAKVETTAKKADADAVQASESAEAAIEEAAAVAVVN